MIEMSGEQLVESLRRRRSRSSFGLLRVPVSRCGREPELAVTLGVDACDACDLLRSSVPVGSGYASITSARVFDLVDKIASDRNRFGAVIIYNMDLAFSYLSDSQREDAWRLLINSLTNRRTPVLILMPESAYECLLSPMVIRDLEEAQMVASLNEEA